MRTPSPPTGPGPPPSAPSSSIAPCPFNIGAWRHALREHPDRALVARLLDGIEHGVDVRYTGDRSVCRHHVDNLRSASEQPAAIDAYLASEVKAGRQAGPFAAPPMPNFIASPLGTVPKNKTTHRVIHHLSYPHGGESVNSKIEEMECVLTSFDQGADLVKLAGRGALMTKIDIKAAYRCIPVRAADWHLLGMRWRDKFYYDKSLPFGLRSSCALWEEFATAAEWIIRSYGITTLVHYIDDTLLVAPAGMSRARAITLVVLRVLAALGMPIAEDKLIGPVTRLIYLGIQLDSVTMTASLGAERLAEIKALLAAWSARASCSHRDLLSLIGKLSFATKVVRPGRIFLRRMLNLAAATQGRPRIALNDDFRADLRWWTASVERWDGVSLLYDQEWAAAPTCNVTTDACETGAGAVCGSAWFAHRWTSEELATARGSDGERSMPYLELLALAMAAATWSSGGAWAGRRVTFHCDCEPVVHALAKHTSPSPRLMHLIRVLFLIAARAHFEFRVVHIAGVSNDAADALSRGQVEAFRSRYPTSTPSPATPSPLPTLSC